METSAPTSHKVELTLSKGDHDILYERHVKQTDKYDVGTDDTWVNGELANAAIYFILAALGHKLAQAWWPAAWASVRPRRPRTTVRRNIVIAAALLHAEVDRLDRFDPNTDMLTPVQGNLLLPENQPKA